MNSGRVLTKEEMIELQAQQYQELIRDFAAQLLFTVSGYPSQIHFTRLFATIDSFKSDVGRRDIMPKIIAEIEASDKPADKIYAAVALWRLREKIYNEDNTQKHYDYIVDAMRDEKISLSCMNDIFRHFSMHNYSYLHQISNNHRVQKLLFPADHAPAWLAMIEQLQTIAEAKLVRDVAELQSPKAKLKLLAEAEQMAVFKAHTYNHVIGSLFSRKSAISTIQDMAAQVRAEPENKAASLK